jgi:predicted DNA-binding protein
MPIRFPEPLYQRLKEWSNEHNFPMAVVVRGLVERFLDEQQHRAA